MIDNRILFVLEVLHNKPSRTVDSYDETLLEKFGISQRQLGRLLDDIATSVENIEIIKIGKRKSYKLIKPLDIFEKTLEKSDSIGMLLTMAHESDPEVFEGLEKFTKVNEDIFVFKNTPFEDTKTLEEKETFKRLKDAVKNREYRKNNIQRKCGR